MKVAVFGGSNTTPEDYTQAERLGKMLGSGGHIVMSGGYVGTMEAVSKGASENGGHVIGVTCEEIENWRPRSVNRWVKEEIRCRTLVERLLVLVTNCEAAIALPGGAGTLTEIALVWNMLFTDILSPKPLILVSDRWKDVFKQLFLSLDGYIPDFERRWLSFATDVDQAFRLLTLNQNRTPD